MQSDAGRYRQLGEQWAVTATRQEDAGLLAQRDWQGAVEIRPTGLEYRCLCGRVHRADVGALAESVTISGCGRHALTIRASIPDSPTRQLRRQA